MRYDTGASINEGDFVLVSLSSVTLSRYERKKVTSHDDSCPLSSFFYFQLILESLLSYSLLISYDIIIIIIALYVAILFLFYYLKNIMTFNSLVVFATCKTLSTFSIREKKARAQF